MARISSAEVQTEVSRTRYPLQLSPVEGPTIWLEPSQCPHSEKFPLVFRPQLTEGGRVEIGRATLPSGYRAP
jgi:hypothetical protein